MTLGIGLTCKEGVVLLTDSMRIWAYAEGSYSVPGARKPWWLKAANVCVVASGRHCPIDKLAPLVTEPRFAPAVRELYDALVELDRIAGKDMPPERWERLKRDSGEAPQLLAAGGPQGAFPSFASLSPSAARWYASGGESALHGVGIWTPWLKEHSPASSPVTLAECRRLALSLAAEFLAELYQGKTFEQWCDEGLTIGAGWPLNLVTFDHTGASRQELLTEEEAMREFSIAAA